MFCSTQAGKVFINPGKAHFEGLVHLLTYFRDNKNLGLIYYYKIKGTTLRGALHDNFHGLSGFGFCRETRAHKKSTRHRPSEQT